MRITNKVLVKGYLGNITANLENMRKYQDQLSSGKEIRRPSDNPFKVARAMEFQTNISINERYKTNIEEGTGWLDTTDMALGQVGDVLQRIRELTVSGGNGTYSQDERKSIATEIDQLKETLTQIGNTAFDGRYIFGGDKTTEAPFNTNGTYQGSSIGLKRELSQGIVLDIAVRGDQFKIKDTSTNMDVSVFETIEKISNDLKNNNLPASNLGELDNQINNILKLRAEVGAKSNRLEAMKDKNEEETFNMTEILSKTEDIDIAKKVMEYKVMENIYTAALQTGAKILQPSLLDFLR